MKKFIPAILMFGILTTGCGDLKRTRDALLSASARYYLIQNFQISARRNKTSIKASVYFSQLRENTQQKFARQVEFNNVEMTRGLLKYESPDDLTCGETKKADEEPGLLEPRLQLQPMSEPTPDPVPKESDFYIVQDNFNELNKITVTDAEGKSQEFFIRLDPLRLSNPETIKLSRTKDNIIQLTGKNSGKKEHSNFYIAQENGAFLDEKTIPYEPSDKTIRIPAGALKKFRKGMATFFLNSWDFNDLLTPGLSMGNNFTVSFTDEICVEIVD